MNSESSPPDFNRLARLYRWMEWASFGPWLWWCRSYFLDSLGRCCNALVLGDGDGRFTARLLERNRQIRIDAVDCSLAMLEALVQRAGPDSARATTYCADARHWQPANPPYDLVVTHFFLDCLTTEEVHSLAATIRQASSPSTVWVVSEFAIPAGNFGHLIAKPLILFLYCAFALLTGLTIRALPDYRAALQTCGFTLARQRTWLGGLLVSELWSAKNCTEAGAEQYQASERYPSAMGGSGKNQGAAPVAFQINASDNVATLLENAQPGTVTVRGSAGDLLLAMRESIEAGHKVAIKSIADGAHVIKFGVVIGSASRTIEAGEWVHLHNCRSRLDERSNAFDVHTGVPEDVRYE